MFISWMMLFKHLTLLFLFSSIISLFFFKSAEVSLVIVPIVLVCYVDMLSPKIICYPNPKLRAHV